MNARDMQKALANPIQYYKDQQGPQTLSELLPAHLAHAGASIAPVLGGAALARNAIDNDRVPWTELSALKPQGLDIGADVQFAPHANYLYNPPAGNNPIAKFFNRLAERATGLKLKNPAGKHGDVINVVKGTAPTMETSFQALNPSRSAIAHEFGHAMAHYSTNPLSRFLSRARGPVGLAGGLGGSVLNAMALTGRKGLDERNKLLDAASVTAGVGAAPTLINEFQASRNAMNLLSKLPNKAEALTAARRSLPRAYASYLGLALAGVLGPQAAKHVINRRD